MSYQISFGASVHGNNHDMPFGILQRSSLKMGFGLFCIFVCVHLGWIRERELVNCLKGNLDPSGWIKNQN